MRDYKKVFAIKKANEKRIKKVCPNIKDMPGIYFFHRVNEFGTRSGYVGLSTRSVLQRCAEHLSTFQYIDNSIRSHGLYDEDKNPHGYQVRILQYESNPDKLNKLEQEFIEFFGKSYDLKNLTSGSQGIGKEKIADFKPSKGYRDGLAQGEENARRFIANLFEKHMNYAVKKEGHKTQERMKVKFEDWLKGKTDESN